MPHVGVEGLGAGDHPPPVAPGARHRLLQDAHPLVQRLVEPFLLAPDHPAHEVQALAHLRVGAAHHLRHRGGELVQERAVQPQHPSEPHRPAQDPPQHVAPAFVGREDAVADQKRAGAGMVRDHAEGEAGGACLVTPPRQALRLADVRREEVGVEVRRHALEHGGDALQAHAGVDAGARQRPQVPRRVALVLHEHQVPDLQPPVAPTPVQGANLCIAAVFHAPVDDDLGARAARTRITHRPEVVLLTQADDALRRDLRQFKPQRVGLVVIAVDSGPETLLR